jgi:diguanylate cyclase (GGDEF)-like protein/PAS domain S-box-containing protein
LDARNTTGWVGLATAIAVLGVGGSWYAAWEVERNAVEHWQTLAVTEAADVTESIVVSLERAETALFAFERGLPDFPDDAETPPWEPGRFVGEAQAHRLLSGDPRFQALGFAERLRSDERAAFQERHGLTIVGPDRATVDGESESFVVLKAVGAEDALFPGLDLAADSRLAAIAADGFRAGGRAVTGASFGWMERRLTPIAVHHGDHGVVLGLLDLTRLLDGTLAVSMPEGLSVSVEERAAGSLETDRQVIHQRGGSAGAETVVWESRYAQGGVGWRFAWSADDRFMGGISTNLADGLRVGGVLGSALILGILAMAVSARRREDALNRERALMQATVERMAEGISVVAPDLRIIGANAFFGRLYDLPPALCQPGRSAADIIRFRLERGDFDADGDPEEVFERHAAPFRETRSEVVEETLKDGRIVEIRRQRTEDGLLVSLYLDVTTERRAASERAASAALIETTFAHMSDGLTAIDRDGRILNWNPRFLELFGLSPDAVNEGDDLATLLHDHLGQGDGSAVAVAFEHMGLRPGTPPKPAGDGEAETVMLSGDRWLEISHRPIPNRGCVVTYADVTERMRTNEMLRRSEERYALAAEGANDGLWDWDIPADRLYTSPRWREMLGLGAAAVTERPDQWFDRVHPSDADELQIAISEHLDGRTEHFQSEFRILHEDGAYIWTLARGLAVRHAGGQAVRMTGSLTDVTERKRAEEKLIRDALYDTITGLPNRALFLDRIDQEIRRHADPEDLEFAVLFLDLDRFKVINDSLGHDLGDALLINVARRLRKSVKPGDSVARLAGDEFGILLTETPDRDSAVDAAHWLQADMARAFSLGDQEVFTSVSIGIALPSKEFADAAEMLRAADIAMYKAKERGQGSTSVFHSMMQTKAISQMQLENDLRRAVDRDEIEMVYQPIVSLADGTLAGVEALARWRHPDRGAVVPAEFIPLAEDTGLISRIGTTALRLACKQIREWEETLGARAPATMSVNLSGRQLQDPDMVREIEMILARAHVDGARLKLEVTESTIMKNPEVTSRLLMDLKELGVALSIDDFGTGYSSLSYLHRFPFDTLKIDRSFIVSMEDKRENMEIIRSITLLAHNLGMDVIAEGIESERHLRHLVGLGCEFGQGFHFATPQTADAITEIIRNDERWPIPPGEPIVVRSEVDRRRSARAPR